MFSFVIFWSVRGTRVQLLNYIFVIPILSVRNRLDIDIGIIVLSVPKREALI